jgi:hypothetical protein
MYIRFLRLSLNIDTLLIYFGGKYHGREEISRNHQEGTRNQKSACRTCEEGRREEKSAREKGGFQEVTSLNSFCDSWLKLTFPCFA